MSAVIEKSLSGAVVVITGARGGIGRAICQALSNVGAIVVATDVCDLPDDLAVDAWLLHDVTSEDHWTHLVELVRQRFGRLDCLINNAGLSLVQSIAETSAAQCRRLYEVNVQGILLGLKASIPLLRESGARRAGGSSVINVSSTAGLRGVAFNGAYCASKAAVRLLSKAAAKEFAILKYPIRVNSIHPGPVETLMMDSILDQYVRMGLTPSREAQAASWNSMNPLGRMAQPTEIAGGVVFLCSPASSFMTGSELVIDGGITA